MTINKTRTTISVDPTILKGYKKLCKNTGMKMSPQLELFMKNQIEQKTSR